MSVAVNVYVVVVSGLAVGFDTDDDDNPDEGVQL